MTDSRTRLRLEGSAWAARLYYAAGRVTDGRSLLATEPITGFRRGPAAGYVIPLVVVLPGVQVGGEATVQIRIWNVNAGETYEKASMSPQGVIGQSELVYLPFTGGTGDPPVPFPRDVFPLSAFSVFPVPEPSSEMVVLWALIATCLLKRIGSNKRRS